MSGSPPAVTLILDECVPDTVWVAVNDHNTLGSYPIDAVQVGKLAALPKHTPDGRILEWAEQNGRVIISRDRNTMTDEYTRRLAAGGHSAGVLIIAPCPIPLLIAHLATISHATAPHDWFDRLDYFP